MSAALVCNNFFPIPQKISFHVKKNVTRRCPMSTSIKIFLALELSQYSKSGSMFSSSKPVASHSDQQPTRKHPVFDLTSPIHTNCAANWL